MNTTMKERIALEMDRKVVRFVSIVLSGGSYTQAWNDVTKNSTWGPKLRAELESCCVEEANAALARLRAT